MLLEPGVDWGVLPVAGVGAVVGLRHAFEPDHLAAITTLAAREKAWGHAARLGIAWGVGHTLTVGAVALLLIVMNVHLPARLSVAAEAGVAALLVLLGLSTLWRESRGHRASLGDEPLAGSGTRASRPPPPETRSASRAFGFGLAHGLAGSGAVMVLLVAAAATGREQVMYLAAFGMGTIAGMTGVTLLTGAVAGAAARSHPLATRSLHVGSAVASTAAGLVLGWKVLG